MSSCMIVLLTCVLTSRYFVFLCLYAVSKITVNACSWPGDVFCAFFKLFLYTLNEQYALVHFRIILGIKILHPFCKECVLAFSVIVQSSLYVLIMHTELHSKSSVYSLFILSSKSFLIIPDFKISWSRHEMSFASHFTSVNCI